MKNLSLRIRNIDAGLGSACDFVLNETADVVKLQEHSPGCDVLLSLVCREYPSSWSVIKPRQHVAATPSSLLGGSSGG